MSDFVHGVFEALRDSRIALSSEDEETHDFADGLQRRVEAPYEKRGTRLRKAVQIPTESNLARVWHPIALATSMRLPS